MKLGVLKSAVAIACGTLLFLSCATFDVWPLTWFAVAPLIAVVLDQRTQKPAFYGFLCGLCANGGGFYWIVGFLQRFGHLPLVAAIPIFLLLISYQAITFALFAWALRRLRDAFSLGERVLFLAPLLYVTFELLVPSVFPWYLAITQAWVRPAIQIAELTGPLGVSFVLLLSNALVYEFAMSVRRRDWRWSRLLVGAAVIAGTFAFGLVRIRQVEKTRAVAPKLKIGVVQANIGIHEKAKRGLEDVQLMLHQELSRSLVEKGAELIIWPESSYPFWFERSQSHDWSVSDRRHVQRGFQTPILFGSLTASSDAQYAYNSALLLDEKGDVRGSFDKNILMVFGEYIPYYEQMKWIHQLIPATSNFSRGTEIAVFPLEHKGETFRLAPMICYEDIFPSFGRRVTKLDPNLLVNITNDAWFGRTSEPYEHLALSVFRSVETRLDLARAVNTGVSALVDSTGRVYAKTRSVDPDEAPAPEPMVLLEEVALQKPQTLYSTLGEWFGGICLLVTAFLAIAARRRVGHPVAWNLVALAVGALTGTTLLVAAILCGPSHLDMAALLIAHHTLAPGSAALAFSTGVRLFPAIALGCMVAGLLLYRRARKLVTVEAAIAISAVLVVPALIWGTLEGEQAGLVLSALFALALTWGAMWIARRFLQHSR